MLFWIVSCRVVCFFFFFSSRRRHTRLQGDWSSDVCSSDLRNANDLAMSAELEVEDGGDGAGERADVRVLDVAAVLAQMEDRKSTRLNSSHLVISYAVFCLKKKKKKKEHRYSERITLSTK